MLGDRVQEIVDFAKTESPYQSANKGWITEDIFLQWGSSDSKSSKNLDKLVKVSFFWQPIIQLLVILFVIAALAILFAFTPIALSNGKFSLIKATGFFQSNTKVENLSTSLKAQEDNENNFNRIGDSEIKKLNEIVKEVKVESKTLKEVKVKSKTVKKVITATDLFQGNSR